MNGNYFRVIWYAVIVARTAKVQMAPLQQLQAIVRGVMPQSL